MGGLEHKTRENEIGNKSGPNIGVAPDEHNSSQKIQIVPNLTSMHHGDTQDRKQGINI
jgi:hypothetical protein